MNEKLEIRRISDRVIDFREGGVDAYLVLGDERALLVDALMHDVGLVEAIREQTKLPVTAVITHGHGDHAGAEVKNLRAAGIDVYMAEVDVELLARMFGKGEDMRGWFMPLEDGDVFDLGGVRLETILVPGHTPGSVVLYDAERKWMFSGDTVGSCNFWMQLDGCEPLGRFAGNLDRLIERVGAGEELTIFPGHRNQSPEHLTGLYLEDVRFITRGILAGEISGEPIVIRLGSREMHCFSAAHGLMNAYCFSKENL